MSFLGDTLVVAAKDLRIEARRPDGLASMVFLAVVVVLVLALAMGPAPGIARAAGPAALWVAGLLAATVGLSRLLERERTLSGWSSLLLAPVSRGALFAGKSAVLALLVVLTDAVVLPLVAILFGLPVLGVLGSVGALLLLGALGYALVGTLLGALALRTRTGDLLLGAVLYPLVVPVLVAGVKGTVAALDGGGWSELDQWVGLLVFSDALYAVAGLWLFDALAVE